MSLGKQVHYSDILIIVNLRSLCHYSSTTISCPPSCACPTYRVLLPAVPPVSDPHPTLSHLSALNEKYMVKFFSSTIDYECNLKIDESFITWLLLCHFSILQERFSTKIGCKCSSDETVLNDSFQTANWRWIIYVKWILNEMPRFTGEEPSQLSTRLHPFAFEMFPQNFYYWKFF